MPGESDLSRADRGAARSRFRGCAGIAERYAGAAIDVVFSLGVSHPRKSGSNLSNLKRIARRFVVVHTLTHQNHSIGWVDSATREADWITKGTSSVSWTPHYLGLAHCASDSAQEHRFSSIQTCSRSNWPSFRNALACAPEAARRRMLNAAGIRIGYYKNQQFEYFRYSGLNPNYFTYVLTV